MRTIHHNRQQRRVAQCMRARRPGSSDEPALFRRRVALRAYGGDLARLAEDIADQLQLSEDVIEDLLWPKCNRA